MASEEGVDFCQSKKRLINFAEDIPVEELAAVTVEFENEMAPAKQAAREVLDR